MSAKLEHVHDYARILLAGIRLFNGTAALFAPTWMAGRLGANPNSAIVYALRMFGVRTIIIGIELLVTNEERRANALRYAIPIHASDTLTAALAGIQGQLPPRTSILLTTLSGFNTTLAILAQPPKQGGYAIIRDMPESDKDNALSTTSER